MLDRVSLPTSVPTAESDPRTSTSVDFLSLLSAVNRRRLLVGSTRAVYPGGTVLLHPNDPPVIFLIVGGLARMFWNVPDGRQATILFLRANELFGGASVVGFAPWTFVQVVTDSTLMMLDVDNVRSLAATNLEVSAAIGAHLASRVRNAHRMIAVRTLGTIRERLAYDLLERACAIQRVNGRLEARATQADLADSIGSSREVMSRALRDLREEGIVETAPGVTRVLNPNGLAAIVRAFVI